MAPDDEADRAESGPAQKARGLEGGAAPKASGDVGKALRSVWQGTLDEQVPDDMIDLLGKLS